MALEPEKAFAIFFYEFAKTEVSLWLFEPCNMAFVFSSQPALSMWRILERRTKNLAPGGGDLRKHIRNRIAFLFVIDETYQIYKLWNKKSEYFEFLFLRLCLSIEATEPAITFSNIVLYFIKALFIASILEFFCYTLLVLQNDRMILLLWYLTSVFLLYFEMT
jgi:hypothetical protein